MQGWCHHYYRIHHRQCPITAGLFRTGGDSISPPVSNGPSGDALDSITAGSYYEPAVIRKHYRRVHLEPAVIDYHRRFETNRR